MAWLNGGEPGRGRTRRAKTAAGARYFATDTGAITFSTGVGWKADSVITEAEANGIISGQLAGRPQPVTCVGYIFIDENGIQYEAFPTAWATINGPQSGVDATARASAASALSLAGTALPVLTAASQLVSNAKLICPIYDPAVGPPSVFNIGLVPAAQGIAIANIGPALMILGSGGNTLSCGIGEVVIFDIGVSGGSNTFTVLDRITLPATDSTARTAAAAAVSSAASALSGATDAAASAAAAVTAASTAASAVAVKGRKGVPAPKPLLVTDLACYRIACTVTNGSAALTLSAGANNVLRPGMTIWGAGIPSGTKISAAWVLSASNTNVTMTANATAGGSGVWLVFLPASLIGPTFTISASGGNFGRAFLTKETDADGNLLWAEPTNFSGNKIGRAHV